MTDTSVAPSTVDRILAGGGEMGRLMREVDWGGTPLGPVSQWPQSLRTAVSMMLDSRFAMVVAWGPEFIFLYNDRYRPVLGASKHPRALGRPAREIFPEVWDFIGPLFRQAVSGDAVALDDVLIPLDRNGYLEECFFTLSYSPIRDERSDVGGMLAVVAETTERVQGERRLLTLRDLAARTNEAKTAEQALENAAATLGRNTSDVPFALLFLVDDEGRRARLVVTSGFLEGPAGEQTVLLDGDDGPGWPLGRAARASGATVVHDLRGLGTFPGGAYPEPTHSAVILPLTRPGLPHPYGFLVAGVSPRRALDEKYQVFYALAADQIVTAIANARAYQEERRRAEALAELDRAKTTFFSNISHEFRTPLTLMLGPTEDALGSPERALRGTDLETVHRNELRLLRLVNGLLDFSRIEAGRVEASYQPTDLAATTADLASSFRSAVERAGLRLEVDCPPATSVAYVDRDMWETIVLNLLSNAFKFTFEGSIRVAVREVPGHFELEVADSGVGIPAAELPRLFERFHRIEGARARTQEGSGIGLALVQDLVKLNGGTISVTTEEGRGTTFVVSLPTGAAHLPADRVGGPAPASSGSRADSFVVEALRWLPQDASELPDATSAADLGPPSAGAGARVLVADDNADLREYLRRLLQPQFLVEVVSDGAQALAAARANPPDLVLTDVMMPHLDGFGLLRELRADERTSDIPVIMLSARAGEEARLDGFQAGADDYVVKPFAARELLVRLTAQIEARRVRRENARERALLLERERELRQEAENANRSKDAFLAMLGHELRNPLSPIVTAVQLLRMRGHTAREIDIIERQVRQLGRMVDDLLDIARITRGKVELRKERIELAAVVLRGLEMASPLLELRRHSLDLNVPPEGLLVEGDEDRLAQVLSNLLTNAAKYSEVDTTIHVTAEREGGRAVLRVRDHGIGIPPEMLERVFELFVQEAQSLDRAKGGLGLGLTIVRRLLQLHGGTVTAHSAGTGQGSEFVVTLPLASPLAELGARPAARTAPSPLRPLADPSRNRVLIVDDNTDAAQTIGDVLVELGYQVEIAHDGPSALERARTFKPNVCLLDIGLPVMDGYEVARRLRAVAGVPADLRIVALTGYGQDADRQRSEEAGFDGHVVKPVDIKTLSHLVSN
jgi:signal transduction histidine kinase